MLDQHADEAFHRTKRRAMNHHRPGPGAVGGLVLQVEAGGQLEVHLDRRHLPGATDRVAGLHRDLRPIERRAARVQ